MNNFCWKFPRLGLAWLAILLAAVALSACGGSKDSATNTTGQNGALAVSLTDGAGDFAAYTVDVVALSLTRADGTVVSTLPLSTRLDFTQYIDMSEFLTMATIPAGTYVAATLTLDYSNADIRVENSGGDLVKVAKIIDAAGNPLSQVAVAVRLDDRNRLLIAPGVPMHLQLDYDLKATNTVTFDTQGVATMSVEPYLIADLNHDDGSKTQRVRGLLDTVAPAEHTFTALIRPFYAALSGDHQHFGLTTVTTDSATLYDLNGTSYQGPDGLTAMQGLAPHCALVVLGRLEFAPLRFVATQVSGGSSVAWSGKDIAAGTVLARSGNSLRLKGATLVHSDGSLTFNDLLTVTIASGTGVRRQLSAASFTSADISVGQRLTVFGALNLDDPQNPFLDATAGQVNLEMTTLLGKVVTVNSADPVAQLNLGLLAINPHRATLFDFSGTGSEAGSNADPNNYQIQTGALSLAGLSPGSPVMVRGFVQPFGAAPQDFNAQTIINLTNAGALLRVSWLPANASAFSDVSATGLTLNLTGVGPEHCVFRGLAPTDLNTLGQSPQIIPRADNKGLFILRVDGTLQPFATFENFRSAVAEALTNGKLARTVWAQGDFADATATLSADRVDLQLVSPL